MLVNVRSAWFNGLITGIIAMLAVLGLQSGRWTFAIVAMLFIVYRLLLAIKFAPDIVIEGRLKSRRR